MVSGPGSWGAGGKGMSKAERDGWTRMGWDEQDAEQ